MSAGDADAGRCRAGSGEDARGLLSALRSISAWRRQYRIDGMGHQSRLIRLAMPRTACRSDPRRALHRRAISAAPEGGAFS